MWRLLFLALLLRPAATQLSGPVGPLTSYTSKAATKVCNIIDYGGYPNNGTDVGLALLRAWDDCAKGGLVYIPPGNYNMATFSELKDGVSSAVQLDGVLNRTGSDGDTVLTFRNCVDFEFFSGNSKGAIQGNGYEYLANDEYGPRLMRFQDMGNFSVHGFALIDSPSYYLTLDTVSNGEVYNIIMRGPTVLGATDAIDVWGQNMWIHDIEATNGDECVTVKNPASNMLIEDIFYNVSGGMSIGSLSTNTDISDIYYRRIYANNADPCFIKYHGGNGTVKNIVWDTVTVHGGVYPLSIDGAWGDKSEGDGVEISNLTFKNSRSSIRFQCSSEVPCTNINLEDVFIFSEGSYATYECENAFGDGACLNSTATATASGGYTVVQTVTSVATYTTSWMANELTSELLANSSFTIPPVPTSFYPGQTPLAASSQQTSLSGLTPTAATSSAQAEKTGGSTSLTPEDPANGSGHPENDLPEVRVHSEVSDPKHRGHLAYHLKNKGH
ncbi:rhamnogalacturonase A precursor [Aspergillus sclerotiicarbonarius CBS 121057]|uniref:Rhamnogalacturonase A n=1 Tax=Aspergillus sclerotiicarbonarius (strain CBS 121057 / IBT 28362) TaxID=1448318 RepID=A0A319EMM0_ASPSB|nr:rhamnogalacturonase A precursor [Aspergillus sclerotiicarbonarius CBS 121057]